MLHGLQLSAAFYVVRSLKNERRALREPATLAAIGAILDDTARIVADRMTSRRASNDARLLLLMVIFVLRDIDDEHVLVARSREILLFSGARTGSAAGHSRDPDL